MSIKNEKFKSAAEEIVAQLTIKKSADEQIKSIKERMKDEHDIPGAELSKYAAKMFKKQEDSSKYLEESDFMQRMYEEVDDYDA